MVSMQIRIGIQLFASMRKERKVRKGGMEEVEVRKRVKELGDNKQLYARPLQIGLSRMRIKNI